MQLSPASRVDSFLADLRQHGAASRPAPAPEPEPEPAFAAPAPADETPGVELFVSASSSLCRTAKLILADIGVQYVELEVGRDISEAELVQRRGGPFAMLPLLAVGGRFVGGFPELKELASGGAEALLSAAADDNDDSSPASRSSASPSLVHEKLHYEAESHEARRAALQREGIAHGLASPMSAERPPERPASPPQVKPTLVHSPGRELVGQERSGPGVHSLIQTDRALMRHDAPHIAVRRGGGWDSGRASGPSPRASARNAQPSPGSSRAPQRQPQRRRRRRQQPGGDRSDGRSSTSSLPERAATPEVDADELRLKAEEVGERLARLGVGCRLGETSDILAALPLLGLSGEAITVAQAQAGGANASLTLLRVLEGALSRFEQSMQPAAHSPGS